MSFLIALAAGAAIAAAQPSPTPSAPAGADPAARAARLAALPSADRDIDAGLWRALEIAPDRVVCASRTPTGTKMPRQTCGSLRSWFASRRVAEIRERRAPWQLIEEIKEQRKKVLSKARAGG